MKDKPAKNQQIYFKVGWYKMCSAYAARKKHSGIKFNQKSATPRLRSAPALVHFFGTGNYGTIRGVGAYPIMYAMCKGNVTLSSLYLEGDQPQQWGLLVDGNSSCGSTQFNYEDFYAGGTGLGTIGEVIRRAGFGHYFLRGGFLAGAGGALAQEPLQIISAANQGTTATLTSKITIVGTFCDIKSIRVDNSPGCSILCVYLN
jgi:hypothetical protein